MLNIRFGKRAMFLVFFTPGLRDSISHCVGLSICRSVGWSVCLLVSLSVGLSVCWSDWVLVCPSVGLSVC